MTNPSSVLGTNGAYAGRTSPEAINDVATIFGDRCVLSGWSASVSSGYVMSLGGSSTVRDVAVAMNSAGDCVTINNRSHTALSVTVLSSTPSSSLYYSIVAYVEDDPTVTATAKLIDNPTVVNVLAVAGTSSAIPTVAKVRSAIASDGGSTTDYWVRLASVYIPASATSISSSNITSYSPHGVPVSRLWLAVDSTTISSSTETSMGTLTIPAGKWTLLMTAQLSSNTNTGDHGAVVRVRSTSTSGSVICYAKGYWWSDDGADMVVSLVDTGTITTTASTVLYLTKALDTINSDSMLLTRTHVLALKVGD